MTDELYYQIALTMINGVGGILSRQLLSSFGDAQSIFKEKKQTLGRVPGIGATLAAEIKRPEVLERAEREIEFIEKAHIQPLTPSDELYPKRLGECADSPLVLYYKGNADLNAKHILSIVGTRHITPYGQELTEKFIEELSGLFPDTLIISGLAYGVDVMAHKCALKQQMATVGILAHGLDRIYPPAHRSTAIEMLEQGGLLTDFPSGTEPERANFLKRNRIIAGLSDATIVVESASKGGSLVTADLAFNYNREVYAFPGRLNDRYSAGCNQLIHKKKAEIITSVADIVDDLGWTQSTPAPIYRQAELFEEVSPEVRKVVDCLLQVKELHINQMAKQTGMSVQELSNILFELEMDGRIRTLPGDMYSLT